MYAYVRTKYEYGYIYIYNSFSLIRLYRSMILSSAAGLGRWNPPQASDDDFFLQARVPSTIRMVCI